MYRVSFTGYRPQKLPFFGEDDPLCADLKQRIFDEIKKQTTCGAGEFLTGMALGVDMWCAEAVIELKKTQPEVRLTAVLPCRGQDAKWKSADRQRYSGILKSCDKVICLSESYTKDCMLARNRALVELCDILVAVYDGKSGGTKFTVNYAKKIGRKTIIIPPI